MLQLVGARLTIYNLLRQNSGGSNEYVKRFWEDLLKRELSINISIDILVPYNLHKC